MQNFQYKTIDQGLIPTSGVYANSRVAVIDSVSCRNKKPTWWNTSTSTVILQYETFQNYLVNISDGISITRSSKKDLEHAILHATKIWQGAEPNRHPAAYDTNLLQI